MAKPLVIVESPAKARTIAGFLGSDYVVMASMGHVRDLPSKGLSVDVDNHFKVDYEVSASKKNVIAEIRAALKGADELYLATDEDREGEAISWHLLEVLKPKVPVKRMVFHEITRSAIEDAVANSRDLDSGLVDAQESRRIIDRLFGYPVSEVCWRKIRPGLSAGRVQSPAVRMVVQRERERMAFNSAAYWDLTAAVPTEPGFGLRLTAVDSSRVAEGRDFDATGHPKRDDVVVLDEAEARRLLAALAAGAAPAATEDEKGTEPVSAAVPFTVRSVDPKPYTSRPKPPFITSTLQQVGGSRLKMSAQQVMRVAQGLYERGYITYMRTDSTTLSETAISAARATIAERFGPEYLFDGPRTYKGKSKNAQEAHEAIRPAGDTFRHPDALRGELRGDDLRLYELIWQRTVASQMPDARGQSVSVKVGAPAADGRDTEWTASGRTITFPGYLAAYGFGGDDDSVAGGDESARLPELTPGQVLPTPMVAAKGHKTDPPARYTEATLVKALEEKGIGRPSTYASIMGTILDRGYVFKKGQALVPTSDAFAVTQLLEGHFAQLVDYDFTARMEDDLDSIAGGTEQREPWLHRFWFGNGTPGLATLREQALAQADPAAVNAIPIGVDDQGEPVVVRNGKYGPYVKRGDDTASLPDGMALDELTVDAAIELLNAPKGDDPIGTDPVTGLFVYAKNGRFGPYVQLGDVDHLPPGLEKPRMSSLFASMSVATVTLDEALQLLSLPRVVGATEEGVEIVASNGKFGPYLKAGSETRSLDSEELLLTIDEPAARSVLAQPKQFGRRAAPKPPLREMGDDPVSGKPMVVKDGRFGPYVTTGETNASLRKGDTVEGLTPERAAELLEMRRAYELENPGGRKGRKKAPAKKAAAKKAPAKKAAAKKAPAKKAAGTKKAAAKKAPAKEAAAPAAPAGDDSGD